MSRADRKNAVLRKTRLMFQQPLAVTGRSSARNYEALSKTLYNSVRISNFSLKFLQYILNILYFRIKEKKFDFFNPSYQTTTSNLILKWNFLSSCACHGNDFSHSCLKNLTQRFRIAIFIGVCFTALHTRSRCLCFSIFVLYFSSVPVFAPLYDLYLVNKK